MPVHVLSAPTPALRSVTLALGAAPAAGSPRPALLAEVGGSPVVQDPLPLHELDPAPAAGERPRARLVGWRFLVHDPDTNGSDIHGSDIHGSDVHGSDRALATAETTLTPDGWVFSHFSAGPYLASTRRALRQAEALPGTAQARLLSVPGLYMLCLWLHGDLTADEDAQPAAADLLIPLAPAPPGIAAHRPYRMADLLPVLALRMSGEPVLETAV